jgi:hypothetical protein
MPRGRKPAEPVAEELKGRDALLETIAQIVQETVCSIPVCSYKLHLDDARAIVLKMVRLDLLKEDD